MVQQPSQVLVAILMVSASLTTTAALITAIAGWDCVVVCLALSLQWIIGDVLVSGQTSTNLMVRG